MNIVTVTMGTLVNRTLNELQQPSEVGLQTTLGFFVDTDDTALTLADASAVNVSDILEIDSELVLVTAKNSDPVPVLTVSRGYYGSTGASHSGATVVTVNPQYARVRVADAIRRAFPRFEAMGLPMLQTTTVMAGLTNNYITISDSTRDVLAVQFKVNLGRYVEVPGWDFVDTPGGKYLSVPRSVGATDELLVTARIPYRWSTFPVDPGEDATIDMHEGTEDLPAIYAAAWIVSRREISRSQINRSEEWNQGEPQRGGVSATLVRVLWQEFYRALDEARRLPIIPLRRQYRPMARIR